MKSFKLFVCLLGLGLSSFGLHKFYLSVTHANYSPHQKALQITTRIFIDDLQLEINRMHHTAIELATDREPHNIDSTFNDYLQNQLKFKINGKDEVFTYIGKEYTGDMVVFYMEVENLDSIQQIQITNNILYNTYIDQKNIVKTAIYNKNKSTILTYDSNFVLLNF